MISRLFERYFMNWCFAKIVNKCILFALYLKKYAVYLSYNRSNPSKGCYITHFLLKKSQVLLANRKKVTNFAPRI